MKSILLLLSITYLFSLLGASGAVAAPSALHSPDSLGTLTQVGALESSLNRDIIVQGNYAYAGVASSLVVIDISDPANLTRVASLRLGGEIVEIVAMPDFLYISSTNYSELPSNGTGLWIIDISNPLVPVKAGFYYTAWTSALAVQDDFAYLYTENGLEIIDISKQDNPVRVGMLNGIRGLSDIATEGDNLYIAALLFEIIPGMQGIMVFDISDPAQPVYVGQYSHEIASSLYSAFLEVSNSILYYVVSYPRAGFSELKVLDVSSPAKPTLLDSLYISAVSPDLTQSGDIVYLAIGNNSHDGFQIIDVSDPARPTLIGEYGEDRSSYLGDITGISAAGGHVFLSHPGEVQSIDVTAPTSPVLLDTLENPLGYPRRFAVSGDYAYIIDVSIGLRIADISNPSQPVIVGQLPTTGELTDVEVDGNMVTLAAADYAYFVDVSNPQNPVEIGRFQSTGGRFVGVDVQAGYAYLALELVLEENGGRVLVLDITDPTSPRQVGYYEPPASEPFHGFTDVVIQGSYAYLPAYEGLLILDVSDPQGPVKAGEYGRESLWRVSVAISGDYLYLSGCSGLNILDNRNPSQLIGIATYERIGLCESRMAAQANHLFIAAQEGLLALNVSSIANPTLAAFYPSIWGQDVAADENFIFFTSWEGFQILRMAGSITGVVRSPNRSAVPGITMTANGSYTTITDSQGKYTFDGLEHGSYTITPALAGFTFTPQQVQRVIPPNEIANFTMLPLPVSAELTPGVATTLVYTDTQGLPTSLAFPAGAVASATTAVITPTITSDIASSTFTGHAFDLEAFQGGVIVPGLAFSQPISLTIQYSPNDVARISDKEALELWWWDGAAWQDAVNTCQPPGTPQNDPESGIYRLSICKAGLYSLYGPTHAIFLPVMINP